MVHLSVKLMKDKLFTENSIHFNYSGSVERQQNIKTKTQQKLIIKFKVSLTFHPRFHLETFPLFLSCLLKVWKFSDVLTHTDTCSF